MVKQIRITLEDQEHKKFLKYKGNETWATILKRGIESLAFYPREMDWIDRWVESDLYLQIVDENGELK